MVYTTHATKRLTAHLSAPTATEALLSMHLLGNIGVMACCLRIVTGRRRRFSFTDITATCVVVTLTAVLLALSRDLNQRVETLTTIVVPVLVAVMVLLTLREVCFAATARRRPLGSEHDL